MMLEMMSTLEIKLVLIHYLDCIMGWGGGEGKQKQTFALGTLK